MGVADEQVAGGEFEAGDVPGLGLADDSGVMAPDSPQWCDMPREVDPGCSPAVGDEPTPMAVALPSGVLIEFTAAADGIHVLVHGEAGPTELVFDEFVGQPVVVEQAVVVPEAVVEVPVPQTEATVEPSPVVVPEPTAQPLVMQDDTGVYEVGTPQVDTDGDDRADAVVIEEQGLRTVAIDRDGDGWVDRVEVTDLATGDVGVFERQPDGSWSAVDSATGPESQAPAESVVADPFVVPPEAVQSEPLGPDAPIMAQALRQMEETMFGFVSEFFPAAFPGEPWPVDETGRPYPAEVLLRMMTTDDNENRDVRNAALEILSELEKARAVIFK